MYMCMQYSPLMEPSYLMALTTNVEVLLRVAKRCKSYTLSTQTHSLTHKHTHTYQYALLWQRLEWVRLQSQANCPIPETLSRVFVISLPVLIQSASSSLIVGGMCWHSLIWLMQLCFITFPFCTWCCGAKQFGLCTLRTHLNTGTNKC